MFNQLKKDHLEARKNREKIKSNLLGAIIGDCTKENKSPNNDQCLAIIKSFLKKNKQLQEDCSKTVNMSCLSQALIEEEILNSYLPKQLTEKELRAIIEQVIENGTDNIGKVMKYLKDNIANGFDNKMASDIAKELLSNSRP